jgi:hypothetical protein
MRASHRNSVDANQKDIVKALSYAGWHVYVIEHPVDLLVRKGTIIGCIEVKNKDGRNILTDDQETFLEGGGNCGIAYDEEGAIRLANTFS